MSVYLDTSVLVSFFSDDVFSSRADAYVRNNRDTLFVSDFAAAEFSSVVSLAVRTNYLTREAAHTTFADFDDFRLRSTRLAETDSSDFSAAEAVVRRLDLPLRAPDALHIVIARRLGAELATFDEKMAFSARALGLAVAVP